MAAAELKKIEKWRQTHRRNVRLLLRWLPRRGRLSRMWLVGPLLRFFSHRRWLWSLKESAVVPALIGGTTLAFLPILGVQLPLAVTLAFLIRANLPLTVALQFISNPVTMGPIYYVSFLVGHWMVSWMPTMAMEGVEEHFNYWHTFSQMLLGGFFIGLFTGLVLAFFYRLGSRIKKQNHASLRAILKRHRNSNSEPTESSFSGKDADSVVPASDRMVGDADEQGVRSSPEARH